MTHNIAILHLAFLLVFNVLQSKRQPAKKNTFWLSKYTGGQNLLHLSKLNHIAEESGLKINILALQYLLSFSWVGSAIIGCSTIDQCRQNFINVSILDKKVYKKIHGEEKNYTKKSGEDYFDKFRNTKKLKTKAEKILEKDGKD